MGRRQPSGNNSILAWTNGRVEQRANITSSLNLLGNRYLPRRVPLDRRPRCEWVASVLLCNAKKDVQSPQRTFPPKLATSKPDPDKDDLWGAGNGKNQSGGANEPAEESGGDRASGGNNDGDIDESSGVPPGGKGDGENGNNNDGTTDENGGADEKGESGDEGKTKEEEKKPEKNDGDDETTGDLLDEGGSNPETKPDAGGGGGSEERYIPVKGGGEKSKREGKSSMKKKSTSEKKDAKHIKRKPSKKPSGNSVTLNKKYPKKRK
ncbi:S-antigen protein [Folsomia candida]|nr:S-antigen protein [Folsomia candida]